MYCTQVGGSVERRGEANVVVAVILGMVGEIEIDDLDDMAQSLCRVGSIG